MKNILLPTDFSKNSMNAINYAMELFKDENCHFYILNVQKASSFISDDMMVVNTSTTIYKTLIDASKKSIDNIISKVKEKQRNKKHEFYSIVDYDNFIDSINQVSKKHNIDLVIMGTKGASGLEKIFFGSNTVRVMQRCKVPVLAIPDGCKFKKLDKLVFATTNLKLFKNEDFKMLGKMMIFNNSFLHILHLADQNHLAYDDYDNMRFFKENFNEAKHEFIDTTTADIFNAVHNYIENNDIKMLAIMNKKHSFLERLFNKHKVEMFGFKIDIPLLVMQIPD